MVWVREMSKPGAAQRVVEGRVVETGCGLSSRTANGAEQREVVVGRDVQKELIHKMKVAFEGRDARESVELIHGDEEDGESGSRRVVKMNDPAMPSEEERRDHEMTHLPYRSWCRHCIRGRGKEMGHRKSKEEPEGVEIHMDLCFPGGEEGPDKMTVLVARERRTRMTLATALPSKSSGTFVAKRVVAFMREIGCEQGDVTIKSDQEPAMKAIISEIGRVRAAAGGGRMMVESSPVGQSQSNGVVERAIGSAVAQMRVLKDALEGRLGGSIEVKHPVMAWIVEYAALTLNRFEVSADGKTAYERSKSKKAKTMGLEFGEAVMWKKKQSGGRLGKISSTWDDGIYLGVKGGTGEIIIGTIEGVWKTRTVQ